MVSTKLRGSTAGLLAATAVLIASCAAPASSGSGPSGSGAAACTPQDSPVLTLAAYSTPREAYGKIIPAFQTMWKDEHDGQTVIFQESYGGSTTQAQNVVSGFQADIVALSLALTSTSLPTPASSPTTGRPRPMAGWSHRRWCVFDVRPGNPDGLENYNDLTRRWGGDLDPRPRLQRRRAVEHRGCLRRGGARGGARCLGRDDAGAQSLLEGIFSNVTVLDKSARDSIKNFESGNGDVAITYENEVLTAQKAGLPGRDGHPAIDCADREPCGPG